MSLTESEGATAFDMQGSGKTDGLEGVIDTHLSPISPLCQLQSIISLQLASRTI